MTIDFASDTAHAPSVKEAASLHQTVPFPQTISSLLLRSDPQQCADLINQLLVNVSPEMLTSLAGSIGDFTDAQGQPRVTPEQAGQIPPAQVEEIAATAEQHHPGVVEQIQSHTLGWIS